MAECVVRKATAEDCEDIMKLVVELAVFEKMEDQVKIDASVLRRDLFSDHPVCSCLVACSTKEGKEEVTGYALYYHVYSTWEGVALYLEDLYVTPALRGSGMGRMLMQAVVKVGVDRDCCRLHLCVLGWNTFAKEYYQRCGFVDLTETEHWHLMRMTRLQMVDYVKDVKFNF